VLSYGVMLDVPVQLVVFITAASRYGSRRSCPAASTTSPPPASMLAILRPYLKDLPVLADSGYEGAGHGGRVPVRKPAGGGELDLDTRTRNALLRSLRCLGERGFALLSQRWQTPQRVMLSPGKIGDIGQAALVLVQFEHKMIT
jgi:hypothetical protein